MMCSMPGGTHAHTGDSRSAGIRSAVASDEGFSLVELMSVILVITALLFIVMPNYFASGKRAAAVACSTNRALMERADYVYYLQKGDWTAALVSLAPDYLKQVPKCPSGGVYGWIDTPSAQKPMRSMGCSVHFFPEEDQNTGLGFSFTQINTNLSKLIAQYYQTHKKWPRSEFPYNFIDLGLDPDVWSKAYDRAIYKPSGNRIVVSPEKGYQMVVKTEKGKTRTIAAGSEKNLIYSVADGKWYYKEINKENVVDITTLVVEPAKPKGKD